MEVGGRRLESRAWVGQWWRWGACALLLVLLAGCGPSWKAEVVGPTGTPTFVDGRLLGELARFREEVDGQQSVSLDRILAQAGHRAVERVVVTAPDGTRRMWDWAATAEWAWWLADGRLRLAGEVWPVQQVEAFPPEMLRQVELEITDLAPTAAAALGLPPPAQCRGRALPVPPAGHVLVVILDGLGYQRYQEAQAAGLVPSLRALGPVRLGLTVYPSITPVATAALLTGAPPAVNGVDRSGIRSTGAETILDVVSRAGRRAVAVEGSSMPFNLRGAEVHLSGDRDGDGHTDDNVLSNTLAVLQEGMPDLLFVHFHGIDDAGHTYGPASPEQSARIVAVDQAMGTILGALPPDVLIIVLADHGQHPVQEDGRLGNHGTLGVPDMFIPVWVVSS